MKKIFALALVLVTFAALLAGCNKSAADSYHGEISFKQNNRFETMYEVAVELKVLDAAMQANYPGYKKAEIKIAEYEVDLEAEEKEKLCEVSIYGIWKEENGKLNFIHYNRLLAGVPDTNADGTFRPDPQLGTLSIRRAGDFIYVDSLTHNELSMPLEYVKCN